MMTMIDEGLLQEQTSAREREKGNEWRRGIIAISGLNVRWRSGIRIPFRPPGVLVNTTGSGGGRS